MVNQSLSILFYLSRKRQDKNCYCPIYARITIDGIRDEFSVQSKIPPAQWDVKKKKCIGNSTLAQTTNNKLSQLKSEIQKAFLLLGMSGEKVTAAMIIAHLFSKKEKQKNDTHIADTLELPKRVEQLFLSISEYQKDAKKCEKIRNDSVRMERTKDVTALKEEIKKDIEALLKETNICISERRLEKNLMNALYEFMLSFSRHVMGGQRRFSTLRKWHYTKEKIKNFCWYHYHRTTIPLEEIHFSFAQDFYDYLTLIDNCGHNLAMKYIKNTKQVIDRAVNRSWINKNPLDGFKCNYIDPERDPVVMDDIIKLINTELDESLSMVKDVFLFSIFTGFAYEDTRRLEPTDMFTGIDGKLWIGTDRIKNGNGEKVPLLPLPLQMINKYEMHPCRMLDGKLLPLYSNQTYNKKLKIIASKCGIQIDLTTHIARHTFATVITLENDVPIATVGKLMGQKTIRSTEKYAKATSKKISRNMSLLESKLFNTDGTLVAMNREHEE